MVMTDFPATWYVTEEREYLPANDVTSAAGVLTLKVSSGPGAGTAWLIERISIEGLAAGTVAFRLDDPTNGKLVDFSNNVWPNIADQNAPIYVPSGSPIFAIVAAGTVSTQLKVVIQVRVLHSRFG